MACSGTVICVQFTRSPMGTVVNSGAGAVSQTECTCAATSRAQYPMAASCNMHRFQCQHQVGHRFRGADLCMGASRGHTIFTERLARGKERRRLRHSCANSDTTDAQPAPMVRFFLERACTWLDFQCLPATLPVERMFSQWRSHVCKKGRVILHDQIVVHS